MAEPMSFFRQHSGQQQKGVSSYVISLICWAMMVRNALALGNFLRTDEDRMQTVTRWLLTSTDALDFLYQHPEARQKTYWQDFLKVYAGIASAMSNGYHVVFDVDSNS